MRPLITLLAVAALSFALLPACGEGEEVQQIKDGLSQTWDGVKKWTVKNRDEAEKWFEENRPVLEQKFHAAKEKAAELGTDAKAELETAWKNLTEKLGALEKAGEGEWEKARDGVAEAYDSLRNKLVELEGEGK